MPCPNDMNQTLVHEINFLLTCWKLVCVCIFPLIYDIVFLIYIFPWKWTWACNDAKRNPLNFDTFFIFENKMELKVTSCNQKWGTSQNKYYHRQNHSSNEILLWFLSSTGISGFSFIGFFGIFGILGSKSPPWSTAFMFVILHILFHNNKAVFINIAFKVFWVTVNGFFNIESVQLNQTVLLFEFKLPFQTVETLKS